MRISLHWRRVLSAWVLVLILILAGFGTVEMVPSLGLAKTSSELRGARIPQHDPFDLGPPLFDNAESSPDKGELME